MIVADTDVLIDYLAGRGQSARVALELQSGGLHTTSITRFELLAGAYSERKRRAAGDLLAALSTLALDAAAADRAAAVRLDLQNRGMAIGMADSLIAGIVLAHDGVLLTRNPAHFERVGGLRLSRGPG